MALRAAVAFAVGSEAALASVALVAAMPLAMLARPPVLVAEVLRDTSKSLSLSKYTLLPMRTTSIPLLERPALSLLIAVSFVSVASSATLMALPPAGVNVIV